MTHRVFAVAVVAVLALALLFVVLTGCGSSGFRPAVEVPPVTVQPADPVQQEPPVGAPVEVSIPKLGVTDDVIPVGLDMRDNSMELPPIDRLGYYKFAPLPGQKGASVVIGHVDWAKTPGAFKRLVELRPGDRVTVTDDRQAVRTFAVYDVRTILKTEFQTRTVPLVFGARTTTDLVLITCGGDLDGHEYLSNVIASARLVA